MRIRRGRHRRIQLFQFAQQLLRFAQLRQDRVVRFGKFRCHGGCNLNQSPAVTREPIARLNLRFFLGRQSSGGDLIYLMSQQIELLFTRGLGRIKGRVFRFERSQLLENFCKFLPRVACSGKSIKQIELSIGRQE